MSTLVNQIAQAFVAIPRIDDNKMRSLLIILARQMIHIKRLAGARGSQYEFISVGNDPPAHRFIGNIQMHGPTRKAVAQLDPER